MPDKKNKPIIIEGVTQEGKQFRPSDWAERMSGRMATLRNQRIYYSPLLQPSMNKAGYKCVVLDPKLKEDNPTMYDAIIAFAEKNQLNICREDDDDDTTEES